MALVWVLLGNESSTEASQSWPGLWGACPRIKILYVKLYVLFSCIDMEFQRRLQRPELRSHNMGKNFCQWGKGAGESCQPTVFCVPLPERSATGTTPRASTESGRPLWTCCSAWGLWKTADFKMRLNCM